MNERQRQDDDDVGHSWNSLHPGCTEYTATHSSMTSEKFGN